MKRPDPKATAKRVARGTLSGVEKAAGPALSSKLRTALLPVTRGGVHQSLRLREGLARANAALKAGRMDELIEMTEALYQTWPLNSDVVHLRSEALQRQGEVTPRVLMLHRMNVASPTGTRRMTEQRLLGTLAETSPGWRPRIPGPPRPVEPQPGVVLHLLKESAPELTNGFTMRSRYNLLAARSAGVAPVVVTSLGFPRKVGATSWEPVALVDGIPHHRLDLGPHYPYTRPIDGRLADQAWLTAAIAREVRPSVIHASSGYHGFEHALVGLALRDHIRVPMVYEVRSFFESTWSQDERWNDDGELYDLRFATEARAMQAADHVLTIAETMREDIVARGVPPERVTVIPNGVDVAAFQPADADPALVVRYGLQGTFVYGYVSNLDHRRENQELLVEAAAELKRRARRIKVLIVGDGDRRAEVEEIARDRGVADDVVFTGRVPHAEVAAHYALMDAFVVPRRDERASRHVTPLKPYEALAMERPLVVAALPALLEITADDRGLSFPADDAGALATQLERLIDDPSLARRIGVAGREWVARERSWSANGARLVEVYREVQARWVAGAGERGAA